MVNHNNILFRGQLQYVVAYFHHMYVPGLQRNEDEGIQQKVSRWMEAAGMGKVII